MVELKNEPDLFVAQSGNCFGRKVSDQLVANDKLATVGRIQRAQDVQQRAFPGTRLANNRNYFSFPDLNVDPFEHM